MKVKITEHQLIDEFLREILIQWQKFGIVAK